MMVGGRHPDYDSGKKYGAERLSRVESQSSWLQHLREFSFKTVEHITLLWANYFLKQVLFAVYPLSHSIRKKTLRLRRLPFMASSIFRRPVYRHFIAGRFSLIGIIDILFVLAKIIIPFIICLETRSIFRLFCFIHTASTSLSVLDPRKNVHWTSSCIANIKIHRCLRREQNRHKRLSAFLSTRIIWLQRRYFWNRLWWRPRWSLWTTISSSANHFIRSHHFCKNHVLSES